MESTKFTDSFKLFPYKPDRENGRTNNGGIDLLLEPHRISEIHEAHDFPELIKFIASSIDGNCPYFTLGCESGYEDGNYHGYVEFSFKSPLLYNNLPFTSNLDSEFFAWFEGQYPEMLDALKSNLKWEYSSYNYHGTSERLKIAFYYFAVDQKAAGEILYLIQDYLNNRVSVS